MFELMNMKATTSNWKTVLEYAAADDRRRERRHNRQPRSARFGAEDLAFGVTWISFLVAAAANLIWLYR